MPAPITPPFATGTAEVLSSLAEAHINTRRSFFAADKMAPVITVDAETKTIRGLSRADLARAEMTRRASGAVSDRAGFRTTSTTVTIEQWSLATSTGKREIDNQDDVYDIEAAAIAYLTEQYLIRLDMQVATALFTTGLWGTDFTPGTLWSAAGGDPIFDVNTGKLTIGRNGLVNAPDDWFHLFVGTDVWPQIKNRLELRTNAERGMNLTEQQAANILNVGGVHVLKTVRNTAVEGAAVSGAFVFDPQDALLLCVQPSVERIGRMPARVSGAFTFVWQRPEFDENGLRFQSHMDRDADALINEVDAEFAVSLRNAQLGYFFNEVVATP